MPLPRKKKKPETIWTGAKPLPRSDYERSPFAEFERKRWTEEARLEVCPECGSSKGRHLKGCGRSLPAA
jgi:hypothetical protein